MNDSRFWLRSDFGWRQKRKGNRSKRQASAGHIYEALEARQLLSVNCPPTVVDVVFDQGETSRLDQWQSLAIEFSENVNVDETSLSVFDDSMAGVPVDLSGVQFSYDSNTFVATWDLSNLDEALSPGDYSFLIPASSVTDLDDGLSLDGNSDGVAGDAFGGSHYVAFPGDTNLDGTVDVLRDAFQFVANLGASGDAVWQQGDFNGDGNVDVLNDAFALVSNLGQSTQTPGNLSDGSVNLPDEETFDFLAHRDDVPGAINVRELKFLITEVNSDFPRLHFLNTNEHPFHYFFHRDVLGYSQSISQFNSQTYFTNNGRVNLAGTLIAHENYVGTNGQEGLVTLEFWPTDPVAFRFVQTAWELISEAAPWMDGQFAFHPVSETQNEVIQQEQSQFDASGIEIIQSDELFGQVSFQPMNQSESFG
ncbi:hypothetical protein N9L06_06665, partial [Mariniblastus sp.]|nr:hypothetical protein [Mariniblastus sp.]